MVIPVIVETLLLSNIIDQKSYSSLHKAVMVVKCYPLLCFLLISCVYFRLHSAEEQLLALDLRKGAVCGLWTYSLLYLNYILNPVRGLRDLQIDNS